MGWTFVEVMLEKHGKFFNECVLLFKNKGKLNVLKISKTKHKL